MAELVRDRNFERNDLPYYGGSQSQAVLRGQYAKDLCPEDTGNRESHYVFFEFKTNKFHYSSWSESHHNGSIYDQFDRPIQPTPELYKAIEKCLYPICLEVMEREVKRDEEKTLERKAKRRLQKLL